MTFTQWQHSEENQWRDQDVHTQKMMFTMMYRGFETK